MKYKLTFLSFLTSLLLLQSAVAQTSRRLGKEPKTPPDVMVANLKVGVLGGDRDFAERYKFFGGGVRFFPFKNAQRIGFGLEMGKSVLLSEEGFDENFGGIRKQNRAWLVDFPVWFNAVRTKHFSVEGFSGGTLLRQTEALEARYYSKWVNIQQFGYECGICESSSKLLWHGGLQAVYVIPIAQDLNGETKVSLAFPVRYTRYSSGLKAAITGGIEFRIGR